MPKDVAIGVNKRKSQVLNLGQRCRRYLFIIDIPEPKHAYLLRVWAERERDGDSAQIECALRTRRQIWTLFRMKLCMIFHGSRMSIPLYIWRDFTLGMISLTHKCSFNN